MAILTLDAYYNSGSGLGWYAVNSYQLYGFYGANFNDKVAINNYQGSIHISGAAGTDVCSVAHVPCTTYIDDTHFAPAGGASTLLTDNNLTTVMCPVRLHLNNTTAVYAQATRFYVYGATTAVGPSDIVAYGIEQGRGATGGTTRTWQQMSNGSGGGGDNNPYRILLKDETTIARQDQVWYIAISAKPTQVGSKNWNIGAYTEYY